MFDLGRRKSTFLGEEDSTEFTGWKIKKGGRTLFPFFSCKYPYNVSEMYFQVIIIYFLSKKKKVV